MPRTTVLVGDCRTLLKDLPDNSLDSVVTDPPYELGFMGKGWDATGIAYEVGLWREVLRVLKPGGHLLAFGGTRTYHRMACAIEDAGFEIRDQIQWLYGSGFPKSMDLAKSIDKVGEVQAEEWKGWGTALKPANEPICMARKPLSEGTVYANVLRWGTGALNVDACRIETEENLKGGAYAAGGRPAPMSGDDRSGAALGMFQPGARPKGEYVAPSGRWPANVVHDGSEEVLEAFPDAPGQQADVSPDAPSPKTSTVYGAMKREGEASQDSQNAGVVGFKMRPGARRLDSGSAARFFYCAKADRKDRDGGLEAFEKKPLFWSAGTQNPGAFQAEGTDRYARNPHPTVKPVDLMRWLVLLVTPPGGTVLDPFMGSGSTGKACAMEGFNFVGMELDPEYAKIAEARIVHVAEAGAEVVVTESPADVPQAPVRRVGGQMNLFD